MSAKKYLESIILLAETIQEHLEEHPEKADSVLDRLQKIDDGLGMIEMDLDDEGE